MLSCYKSIINDKGRGQMPSLNMKVKSTTGYLKENSSLRVCQKSNIISKAPLSHLKVSQFVEKIGSSDHNHQDDCFNVSAARVCEEAEIPDLARDETNPSGLPKEDECALKQPPDVTESATEDSMEPPLSTGISNTEAVFSHILDSMDVSTNEGRDYFYVPQLDSEDSDDSCGSGNERQPCNVSDFCISDIIFSETCASNPIFENRTDVLSEHECKLGESSLLCNFSEECRLLPFMDDNIDAGHNDDGILPEGTIMIAENSTLYMAIHQLRSRNQESNMNTCSDQDYEFFDPQSYIRNLPDHLDMTSSISATSIPHEKQSTTRITLVLDLDETLVHSTLDPCDDADFTFTVFFDMKEHTVYVKQRPHLLNFLQKVADMFEVVIFTASQSIYAKQLLDILDPDGKFISRRAYRESCMFSEGTYLKDLTVLGVDLAKVVIVDNSPQVYRLQVNNGIPIKSWFDDPSDSALISLLPFLETLRYADDVRPIIASKFGNKE